MRTALFGTAGSMLVTRIQRGTPVGSGSQPYVAPEGATTSLSPGQSNTALLAVTQPSSAQPAPKSLGEEEPVKIIAPLPAELLELPLPAGQSADAAAMSRLLDEAGAHSGDVQISLLWNDYNDLDLHAFDPQGERIWYSHKRSEATGGELDVDRNFHEPYVSSPIENIYWRKSGAPPGIYRVYVVYYGQHANPPLQSSPYTVRVVVEDKTNYFSGRLSFTGKRELHWICTFQYDPAGSDPSKHRRFLSNR